MNLKLMTFNLRVQSLSDLGNAWTWRHKRALDVFHRHQPDIVGTQEGLPTMLADLDRGLPAYRRIGRGRTGGFSDEHCAIFYRIDTVELLDDGQFWLSETPSVPSTAWQSACVRFCTWGRFRQRNSDGCEVGVFNTHLDHQSNLARRSGAAVVYDFGNHLRCVLGVRPKNGTSKWYAE